MSQALKYTMMFALLGAVFFIPFLGAVHLFDWDEVNFAEISREMVITKDYTRIYVDFLPFWEKPPFFFWLQALAMQGFGINEFAARLPNAICGLITLPLLYKIGRTIHNHRLGIIWAGIYLGSILPHLYFRSGIIDPFFNLFIFCGLYLFILFYWKKAGYPATGLSKNQWVYLFWGGFLVGMGILTKGQVAFLVVALCLFVYWILQRFKFYVSVPEFLFFALASTLVSLTWYGLETWKNGSWFITEFNKYQYRLFSTPDAGHRGFPGYHFVVLLIGCFPASIFCIRSFLKLPEQEHKFQENFRIWMIILFWTVLIMFTIVKSKIVHYSSICYFPLTYLAAISIDHLITKRISFAWWMKTGLCLIGGLFVLATIAAPFLAGRMDLLQSYFNDPFAREAMQADVRWTGLEIIPGIILLFVMITCLILFSRKKNLQGFIVLFGGTAIFITMTLFFYAGRIEAYSQRSVVEFCKSKDKEDCYILPLGYKTYSHLFYAQKPMVTDSMSYNNEWLLNGDVGKKVYVITKVHKAHHLEARNNLREIGRKGGFVFFERIDIMEH